MSKDWTGTSKGIFMCLGGRGHGIYEREPNDYYATAPIAAEMLCDMLDLSPNIWECAAGGGHLARVFTARGHNVRATDLVDRGYGESGVNFLEQTEVFDGDIITNPPFKYVSQFITKGLELIPNGRKLILFLRIQCLEGVGRYKIYKDSPPKYIYVASRRIACAKNAEFTTMDRNAACYCWFVWEKGFRGEPTVRWFNTGNDNDCVDMENNDVG